MLNVCTRCGTVCDEPGARFCPRCGGRLEQREGQAAPASVAAAAGLLPNPTIAGARCGAHPDVEAEQVCARCGAFACHACVRVDLSGRPLCATCGARVRLDTWEVPWEKRGELGLIKGYWETAKAAMFTPQRVMVALSPEGDWWDAMSFGLVSHCLSFLGTLLLYVVLIVGIGVAAFMGARSGAHDIEWPTVIGTVIGVVIGVGLFVPISGFMRIYFWAGLEHGMLRLVGGPSIKPFASTFRTLCYSMAPSVWGIIPICGIYAVPVWQIVLEIWGYQGVHKISGGRAAVAVLLPLVTCFGLYMLFVVGAQVLAMSAASASH
jgi:hypothetical protein